MRRDFLLAAALLCALTVSLPARADIASQTTALAISQPKPITLDTALAAAETPKQEIYIAVGADQVSLPSGSLLPNPGDTVTNTALAYGRILVPFDDIEAIAAPTRVVLNTEPPTPNPYDGMPAGDAFQLLLASLTQEQWTKLIGKIGISYRDLTTDEQRALFNAMFPVTPLHVYRMRSPGSNDDVSDEKPPVIQADALRAAHLRLSKSYMLGIPVVGQNSWIDPPLESDDSTTEYGAEATNIQTKGPIYGATLKATVPNTIKDSDLDYNADVLKTWVKLSGVKTVGDLVTRVGLATHLEIYADPHYENRPVMLLGSAPARADDVLQALALCVAGAYRQVGSAYVLTDDLMGVGVRRSIINSFTQLADTGRQDALAKAEDIIFTIHHGVDELTLSGPSDLSPAENDLVLKQRMQPFFIPGERVDIEPKFSEMTPTQRDAITKFKDDWESQPGANDPDRDHLTLDGKMMLSMHAKLDMDVPGLDGVVSLDNYITLYDLFEPSRALRNRLMQKQAATAAAGDDQPKQPDATPQTIALQLRAIGSRALLAGPRTAADVDAIVESMKAVGLNQLWLDVFSGGESHLTRPPKSKGNDILTEALAKTRGSGITVIPTIDVLKWSPDAPADAQDLTMTGETSAQAQTEENRYMYAMHYMQTSDGTEAQLSSDVTFVSPAAPVVRNTLIGMVKKVAAMPGVGGIALRETLSNGYGQDPNGQFNESTYTLGYTEPMRLAFLRKSHEDPIDIDPESNGGEVNPDTTLPDYDDSTVSGTVKKGWAVFRSDIDRALLANLLLTAQTAADGRNIPIWIHDRGQDYMTTWFGLWTDPNAPLPTVPISFAMGGYSPDTDMAAVAGATCRTNMIEIQGWRMGSPGWFSDGLNDVKTGWAGFVVDGSESPGGDPLAGLAKELGPDNSSAQSAGKAATVAAGS